MKAAILIGQLIGVCCDVAIIAIGIATLGYNPLSLHVLTAEEGAFGVVVSVTLILILTVVQMFRKKGDWE